MSVTASIKAVLRTHNRVAITGGPRVGKTTYAKKLVTDRPLIETDDYMDLEWSEVPHAAIRDTRGKPKFVIEGTQVARALRKGMVVDAVIFLTHPRVERTRGQQAMAKAVATVFAEWRSKNPGVPVFVEGPKGEKTNGAI